MRSPDPKLDSLLEDIAKLEKRLCDVLDDRRRIDRVRGVFGANNPYSDFAPKVRSLVERCRLAFDLGRSNVAREAYSAVLNLMMLKDSYGFTVAVPDGLDMPQEYVRYLRAEVESHPVEKQAIRLLESWKKLRAGLWNADKLTITAVLECRPEPLDSHNPLLDQLIALLRKGKEDDDDRWLREAVRLRQGLTGLRKLAHQKGRARPRAWVDWLDLMASNGDTSALREAAKEALRGIPDGWNLRVRAANHWFRAAAALGDIEGAVEARWETFRAQPFPRHLLDLRDAAAAAGAEQRWLKRALACCEMGGGALVPGPFVGGTGREEDRPFLEKGDQFDDGASQPVTACVQLLLGSWEAALALSKKESMLAWNGGTQALVVPVLMAWFAGWPAQPLPRNLAAVFEATMAFMDGSSEPDSHIGARFRTALAESIPAWEVPPEPPRSQLIESCASLVGAYVSGVVKQRWTGAYVEATNLALAAAEVLAICISPSVAQEMLGSLGDRHRRDAEFTATFTAARQRFTNPSNDHLG